MRKATIRRITGETQIDLQLCLDGGAVAIETGIGFFDHMIASFAFHGGFGLEIQAKGDLNVDCHHTIEDTGIVLGLAFKEAMGDRKGIRRFSDVHIPMDEALGFAAVDVSGRPYLVFDAAFPQERIGDYDSCMTLEFFRAFAVNAGITLHLRSLYGSNSHHITEALYKAAAKALRSALVIEGRETPSTKGVLD
jgi:imidazoleglycerol-phosphate dehydratase